MLNTISNPHISTKKRNLNHLLSKNEPKNKNNLPRVDKGSTSLATDCCVYNLLSVLQLGDYKYLLFSSAFPKNEILYPLALTYIVEAEMDLGVTNIP